MTYLYKVLKRRTSRVSYGPITYTDAAVVPVTDFYYFRYSAAQTRRTMDRCDRALLDTSAIWSVQPPLTRPGTSWC